MLFPGDIASMTRDLLTLFDNFKPGMGGLDCFFFALSKQDPRGKTRGICKYLQIFYNIKHFKIYSRNLGSSLPGNKNILSFPIP